MPLNLFCRMVLFLFALFSFRAQAGAPLIAFGYKRAGQIVLPSEAVLKGYQSCGIDVTLGAPHPLSDLDLLSCPGLLDYSQSRPYLAVVMKLLVAAPAEVQAAVRSVRVAVSPHALFSVQGGDEGRRENAINIPSLRLVILNAPHWSLLKATGQSHMVLLHEVLEAAGYDDHGYSQSLNILGYSSVKTERHKWRQEAGISLIGHGGDHVEMLFKASLLRFIHKAKVSGLAEIGVTREEAARAVQEATVVSVPAENLHRSGSCDTVSGDEACGGFAWNHGSKMIVIAKEWNELSLKNQGAPLVTKVMRQVFNVLGCFKRHQCEELR